VIKLVGGKAAMLDLSRVLGVPGFDGGTPR
jgi:hypothetical protein